VKFNKQAYMAKDLRVHNVRMESENGEEGGDSGELVPARSIRFTGINLTEKQFNEMFGHEAASKFFFDFSNGDKGSPAHENCGTIWLDQTYSGCEGAIIFGTGKTEVEFEDARVKNISIKIKKEQRFGSMNLTLVAALPEHISTLQMERFFGKVVTLRLALGEKDETDADQGSLDLGDAEGDESGDEDVAVRERRPVGEENRAH
jgi:hypothetical protein